MGVQDLSAGSIWRVLESDAFLQWYEGEFLKYVESENDDDDIEYKLMVDIEEMFKPIVFATGHGSSEYETVHRSYNFDKNNKSKFARDISKY